MNGGQGMSVIGVIGAGVMGGGVASCLAEFGQKVVLYDISEQAIQCAQTNIRTNLRMRRLFVPTGSQLPDSDLIENITFTTNSSMLSQASVVIENVTEDWEVKKEVYQMLNIHCQPTCMFLANTSCISITRISALMDRPDLVIGAHFMNPVHLKNTVEVIKGYHTSQDCINNTEALLKSINKTMVLVEDMPGFVSNRISHLFMNEAAFVVQDQVAKPEQVDEIFRSCYGHAMGPLETADLIRLDTVVNSLNVLYASYQDSKYRVCPLLQKMVDAGLYGKKSGQGFYQY